MACVFYDTETTGISTSFDQILQFAAILTDDDLNELDRFEIRCRILPWVVPSPGALLTTGVTPDMLVDPSLPSHYEMIAIIEAKLIGWSPAVFVGYNSMKFDETLLRQALFQNLRKPYLTVMTGNVRADVFTMARACAFHAPNVLAVPLNDQGKPVLKLDQLAPANGFDHSNAHDALADVEATIHIAALIRGSARSIWDHLLKLGAKRAATEFVRETDVFIRTDVFGRNAITRPVALCGFDPSYDAQAATFDLTIDPTPYLALDEDGLLEALQTSPKVIRTLRLNSQPLILPMGLVSSETDLGIEPDVMTARAQQIHSDFAFQQRVGVALSRLYEDGEPSPYPEQQIYDGFPSRDDEALMADFHRQSDWSGRVEIASQFKDQRLKHFAYRLIYAAAPDVLSDNHRQQIERWVRDRVLNVDPEVPWSTVGSSETDLEKAREAGGDTDPAVLANIHTALDQMRKKWAAVQ